MKLFQENFTYIYSALLASKPRLYVLSQIISNRSSWPIYFLLYTKHKDFFSMLGFLDVFESLDTMVNSCISDTGEFFDNEEVSGQFSSYGVTVDMLRDFVAYYLEKAVIGSKVLAKSAVDARN